MTKEELSQLGWLNREIEADKQRLNELQSLMRLGTMAAGLPEMSEEERRLAEEEIAVCQAILSARIVRAAMEYRRLLQFIDSVEDSLMRQILSLRYINGLSWQQVAFTIGEHDEQYPRRKHQAFLAKQTKKTKTRLHNSVGEVRQNADTRDRAENGAAAG